MGKCVINKYYKKKGLPPANFFIGGISSILSGVTEIAAELVVSPFKVKHFKIINNDISFHIPSPFFQGQLKWNSIDIRNNLTYYYDVGGNVTTVFQNDFISTTLLERLWVPNCTDFGSGGGFGIVTNTGLKGFVDFPGFIGNNFLNNGFLNNSNNITHLKLPNAKRLSLQQQPRSCLSNMSSLKRVYLPNIEKLNAVYGLFTNTGMFQNIPSNCVFYLPPKFETGRNSEVYVRTIGVLTGDTITLNGLTYTASTTSSEGTFVIGVNNFVTARNLGNAINSDTRTGDFGDLIVPVISSGFDYAIVTQAISGATGDTTTYSSGAPTRLITPSGSTFYSGGTRDRTVVYIEDVIGAEVRYITGTTTPDAVVDLSGTNITSSTVDLVFTPPTGHDRPIDFYEVWINDGVSTGSTIWQDYLPHQEISGSTATVTDLLSGTTYTFRVKAADFLYNVSDFSNTFSATTL